MTDCEANRLGNSVCHPLTILAPRQLPVVNFLDIGDNLLASEIVNEMPPQDRERFRNYLSKRHLAFGLATGVSRCNPTISPREGDY